VGAWPGVAEAAAALSIALSAYGLPRSAARVLALLLLSGVPLTSKEVAKLTGYSKSTISAALRMLEGMKVIRRMRQGRSAAFAASISLSQFLLKVQVDAVEGIVRRVREIKGRADPSLKRRLESIEGELASLSSRLRGVVL